MSGKVRFVGWVAGRRGMPRTFVAHFVDTTMPTWGHFCTDSFVSIESNSSAVFDCCCRSLIEGGVVCRAVGLCTISAFGRASFLACLCCAMPILDCAFKKDCSTVL